MELFSGYVNVIEDMYDGVVTRIRAIRGDFNDHRFALMVAFKPVSFCFSYR